MTTWAKGIYIGPEEQFKGREALLQCVLGSGAVLAQFDEGKTWESHGWLAFNRDEFEIVSNLS